MLVNRIPIAIFIICLLQLHLLLLLVAQEIRTNIQLLDHTIIFTGGIDLLVTVYEHCMLVLILISPLAAFDLDVIDLFKLNMSAIIFLLVVLLLYWLCIITLEDCHSWLVAGTPEGSHRLGRGGLEVGVFTVAACVGHSDLMHFQCALLETHDTIIIELWQLLDFVCLALKLGDPMTEVLRCVVRLCVMRLGIVVIVRLLVLCGILLSV